MKKERSQCRLNRETSTKERRTGMMATAAPKADSLALQAKRGDHAPATGHKWARTGTETAAKTRCTRNPMREDR